MTIAQGLHATGRLEAMRFHFKMALVFTAIAFAGFIPTYFAALAMGSFNAPPIVHVHATLLFSWTLLYLVQTSLVASGHTARHRTMGLLGIALFSVMCCSIVATRLVLLHREVDAGFGDAARRFSAIALCSLPLLVGFFAAAMTHINHPAVHKRWMYLVMVGLMIPAIARVFLVMLKPPGAVGPPPPVVLVLPTLTAALLLIPAFLHERRQQGRVHPVYRYGSALLILWTLAIVPFSGTGAWMAIVRALERLAG